MNLKVHNSLNRGLVILDIYYNSIENCLIRGLPIPSFGFLPVIRIIDYLLFIIVECNEIPNFIRELFIILLNRQNLCVLCDFA